MKSLKLILVLFVALLFSSCDSTRVTVDTNQDYFNSSYYDYNYMDRFYSNNPYFFHNQVWYDDYGMIQYYHNHPYYIRYCRERGINPYRGRSNQNYYYNGRRVTRDANYYPKLRRESNSNIRRTNNYRTNRSNTNIRRTNTNVRRTNNTNIRKTNTMQRRNQTRPVSRKNTSSRRGG